MYTNQMNVNITSDLVNASVNVNNSSTLFLGLFIFAVVVIGILKVR
jgi:hypothetical protein